MWTAALSALSSMANSPGAQATPIEQTMSGGNVNVGIPLTPTMNYGAILEPLLSGGSPYTGGYNIQPMSRLGYSDGGTGVWTAAGGGSLDGISPMLIMGGGAALILLMLFMKRG